MRKANLSLPLGEMSRSDREGWNQLTWFFKFALMQTCSCAALSVIYPDADLFACCSFRHGLRRATFLREEGFGFPRNPNLSLPLGEMSRSDREGRLLLSVLPLHRWRGPPPLSGAAEFGSPERGAVTE